MEFPTAHPKWTNQASNVFSRWMAASLTCFAIPNFGPFQLVDGDLIPMNENIFKTHKEKKRRK